MNSEYITKLECEVCRLGEVNTKLEAEVSALKAELEKARAQSTHQPDTVAELTEKMDRDPIGFWAGQLGVPARVFRGEPTPTPAAEVHKMIDAREAAVRKRYQEAVTGDILGEVDKILGLDAAQPSGDKSAYTFAAGDDASGFGDSDLKEKFKGWAKRQINIGAPLTHGPFKIVPHPEWDRMFDEMPDGELDAEGHRTYRRKFLVESLTAEGLPKIGDSLRCSDIEDVQAVCTHMEEPKSIEGGYELTFVYSTKPRTWRDRPPML